MSCLKSLASRTIMIFWSWCIVSFCFLKPVWLVLGRQFASAYSYKVFVAMRVQSLYRVLAIGYLNIWICLSLKVGHRVGATDMCVVVNTGYVPFSLTSSLAGMLCTRWLSHSGSWLLKASLGCMFQTAMMQVPVLWEWGARIIPEMDISVLKILR